MEKRIKIKFLGCADYISRISVIDKKEFINNFSYYLDKDERENTSRDPYGMGTDSLHFVALGTSIQITDVDTGEVLLEKDFKNFEDCIGKNDEKLPHIELHNYLKDVDSEDKVFRFAEVEEGGCSTLIYLPEGEDFEISRLNLHATRIWGGKTEFIMEHPTYNSVKEGTISAFDFDTADDFANEASWLYHVPGITKYPKPSAFLDSDIEEIKGK